MGLSLYFRDCTKLWSLFPSDCKHVEELRSVKNKDHLFCKSYSKHEFALRHLELLRSAKWIATVFSSSCSVDMPDPALLYVMAASQHKAIHSLKPSGIPLLRYYIDMDAWWNNTTICHPSTITWYLKGEVPLVECIVLWLALETSLFALTILWFGPPIQSVGTSSAFLPVTTQPVEMD